MASNKACEKLQEIRELMGDEIVLNELANYASDDYLEEFVADFRRSYDLNREGEE